MEATRTHFRAIREAATTRDWITNQAYEGEREGWLTSEEAARMRRQAWEAFRLTEMQADRTWSEMLSVEDAQ